MGIGNEIIFALIIFVLLVAFVVLSVYRKKKTLTKETGTTRETKAKKEKKNQVKKLIHKTAGQGPLADIILNFPILAGKRLQMGNIMRIGQKTDIH